MDSSPLLTGPPIPTENAPESSPSLDQRTGNVPEHDSPKSPPRSLVDTGAKPKSNKASSFELVELSKSQETVILNLPLRVLRLLSRTNLKVTGPLKPMNQQMKMI